MAKLINILGLTFEILWKLNASRMSESEIAWR